MRVQIEEIAALLLPPEVRHQVGGDDARKVPRRFDHQAPEAGNGRLEGVEASLRLDVDDRGQLLRDRVREQATVLGPRAVEGSFNALAPDFDELTARSAHDESVRERPPEAAAGVEHVGLASDHRRLLPATLRHRRQEQRVDVGVKTAPAREHVEPNEVGMVRVGVTRGKGVVGEAADEGHRLDTVQLHLRADQVPVEPVRQLVAMHVDLLGRDVLEAGGEREVVHEMERLVAGVEPEHEMGEARDGCLSSGHPSGTAPQVGGGALAAHRSGEPEAEAGGGPPVVLVVPVVPALGGNGLGMRAGMLLEALAGRYAVDLVVVPVSGPLFETGWASTVARSLLVVAPVGDAALAREHLTRQLSDPWLRERLERCAPLPRRVRSVPPTLAAQALADLLPRARRARALFVMRGYLAPFGCALARALGARRVIVDLDDDDEQFERLAGREGEADAIARLARAWLPDADVVCAAAAHEAAAVAERYGLRCVRVLPNAIRPPAETTSPPGERRLLFVGNLTYAPNLEAAHLLAHEILPLVRETHPDATVDLVGRHDGSLARSSHVRVPGRVADVGPWYDGADVVVAPLLRGGGTRIKLLEAFAHRRPVVATAAAVSGLAVRDRHEVSLGGSPAQLAARVGELLAEPWRGAAMVQAAADTLSSHYLPEVIAPQVRALVSDELERTDSGAPPS